MTDWTSAQQRTAPNFEIGDIFSRSLSLYGRRLPVYYLMTLIITLPNLYLVFQNPHPNPLAIGDRPIFSPGYWEVAGPLFAVTIFAYVFQLAALLHVALQDLRGRPFDLGATLLRALLRTLPIMATALFVVLAIWIGAILLIIPAFIVWMMLSVSVQACLDDTPNPFVAMGRSAQLTKGHRWTIFGIEAVYYVAVFIIDLGLRQVLGLAFPQQTVALLSFPVNVALTSYGVVLGAVMYQALREAKEGVASDHIATVFD